MKKAKLSTEPYKGVRDFYPKEMFVENYIFDIMRDTAESFGYSEYSSSLLEPTSLYEAKSGQEIVNDQTYTFIDRGRRSVTLRPEMTPSVARMVAAQKRELMFPLRWYSVPNVFRYERPQRGRLREHWQLNVDLFGISGIEAEVEIISIAYQIMKNFGADGSHFEIRLSYAGLLYEFLRSQFNLSADNTRALIRIIDKIEKISETEFNTQVKDIVGEDGRKKLEIFNTDSGIKEKLKERPEFVYCRNVARYLEHIGITDTNITLEPFLIRGFEYYTGLVFEIFDTSPYNKRSLFGGGRYDNLLEVFGTENVPAVGFGMGDVTVHDFLETRGLLPEYEPATDLYICTLSTEHIPFAMGLAGRLREAGVNAAVHIGEKKVGDQIKYADKQHIPFILCIGEEEIKKRTFLIKNLATREEKELVENDIAHFIFSQPQ